MAQMYEPGVPSSPFRLLTVIATALILLLLATAGASAHSSSPGRCAEDDPCWNCATMGNLVCGTRP